MAEEQPIYEVEDPALSENLRSISYTLDQHRHSNDGSSRLQDTVPDSSSTYILGSTTNPWKNVHSDTGTFKRVNTSTISVNGTNIFVSSFSGNGYDGTILFFASGTIAANSTVNITTYSIPGGASFFGIPICVEHENVNTAGTSIRVKSLSANSTSFIVYNADGSNAKNFGCMVPVKK